MKNEDFIEEDWYHEYLADAEYIAEEKERQMRDDWWQWECEHTKKRKPAIVKVIVPKTQAEEQK